MNITFTGSDNYTLSDFVFEGLRGRRYVVFDVEATGPDENVESVTQIGAVAVYDDGPRDTESFVTLVKPWKTIPEKIERLTGVTNERVAEAADVAQIWPAFVAFCGDSPLVTQCGYEFDFPILDRERSRIGIPPLTNDRLDTKAIFALLHPKRAETFSTNFLAEHFGIDRSPFQRHDALGDARLISRIFHALLAEAHARGIDHLATPSPKMIRRFVLTPL
jgi:DNA polymerase III epsilon subunit-like protein